MHTIIFISVAVVFAVIIASRRNPKVPDTGKLPPENPHSSEYDERIRVFAFTTSLPEDPHVLEEEIESVIHMETSCLSDRGQTYRVEFLDSGYMLFVIIRISSLPGAVHKRGMMPWRR